MNKAERFIQKHLDASEARLLHQYDGWLRTVFSHIPIGAGEHEIHQYHLPQPALLSHILFRHVAEMLTYGQAHGAAEARTIREKHRVKLAELPILDANREFTPEQAIAILKRRELVLAGEVESDLVSAIKKTLLEYLAGATPQSTRSSIAELLNHNKNRASLIVTTETTYAYNRGRLISYRENNVDYVRFSAIMDSRTSQICRSRHGLVMAMDDPALGANTPPLHGRCRSVLTPIYSRYEPDLITEANTDWSKADPLSKSWLSDGKGPKKPVIPSPRTANDQNKFQQSLPSSPSVNPAYLKVLQDRFSSGSAQAKRVYLKYVDKNVVADHNSRDIPHFNPAQRAVHMNFGADLQNPRGAGATFFHEIGHYIDHAAAVLIRGGHKTYDFVSHLSVNGVSKDDYFKAIHNDVNKTVADYMRKHNASMSEAYQKLSSILGQGDGALYSAISDLFGGATGGTVQGLYGHQKSYWLQDANALEKEAFAHMFEASFDPTGKRLDLIKQYLPTAYHIFLKILEAI